MTQHIPSPQDILRARDARRGHRFRLTMVARIVKDLNAGRAAMQADRPETWW